MQSQQPKTTGILKLAKPKKLSKKITIDEAVQEEKKDETLEELKEEFEMNECGASENKYDKKCNKFLLKKELLERKELSRHPEEDDFLYPSLNDPNFIVKIAEKKEFNDTRYDGKIYDIEEQSNLLANAEFELAPQQAFVRNFLSFQTPYNSLLLYHGLGSGKTSSAIGVCEEQRDYLKQMGITKQIIIVASPNVQDNFRLQMFDERKLKQVDGLWNLKGATGNKYLKEINPMNMKGLTKEKVISQVKGIINASYLFLGYIEFANYIEKVKEVKGAFKDEADKQLKMIRNLKYEFDNRLIVIDEIHNIRIAEENKNKKVALQLLDLVKSASNLRLLLLSATPMYNSYKEIIWLLNLMNLNDRRATVEIKDVFDKDGNFKKGPNGEEEGKELLIRKATGYVSFVRGENPYTFPFRVYPSVFSPKSTLDDIRYPKYQMNGKKIKDEDTINILKSTIYLTDIGKYQSMGYQFVIDSLRKKKISITTKTGIVRDMPSFDNMESFGYTLLQIPLEALNIVYPMEGLEYAVENIEPIESLSDSESVLAPKPGPKPTLPVFKNSEQLESSVEPRLAIELTKKPSSEKSLTSYNGGDPDSTSSSGSPQIFINANDLTGKRGLERTMDFIDSKSPPEKGSFEYKKWLIDKNDKIFSPDKIGNYSSKFNSICKNIVSADGHVADGIVLIYSQYIDGGLIPLALALEEMGFSRYGDGAKSLFKTPPTELVDSRTLKPRKNKKDSFMPAKYIMITGDPRISPNNDYEIKAITNDDNKDGHKIKIVLISQAGSEGVDFKFLRQVHIIDPWYNMNRIEQIIGRGVRNFSHKSLNFEDRNVQIFIYGTILENNEEEAADLYVYRVAEYKALQMGRVSRVLKETSVDCIINHDQTNFTQENIEKETTKKVKQVLSNGMVLTDFKVGDIPYSAACDYMADCEYKCYPDKQIDDDNTREDTYNETFIMMNSEKIFQKIRQLFNDKIDGKFFFKKADLIRRINTPKSYPIVQIYAALTQLIEDATESITDKYGRTGHLVNIGEYYLFQPSELNNPRATIFERSVPLDFKHTVVNFELKTDLMREVVEPRPQRAPSAAPVTQLTEEVKKAEIVEEAKIKEEESPVIIEMKANFDLAMSFARTSETVPRGDDNWYKHCGVTMKKLIKNGIITSPDALEFLVEHLVDMLLYHEKLQLINYIYSFDMFEENTFEYYIKKYLDKKIIKTARLTSMILFSGDKIHVMLMKNKKWVQAESEDEREVAMETVSKMDYIHYELNNMIGFIGQDQKNRYLVFKVKDMEAKRNTGARCDEASKTKKIQILIELFGQELFDKYTQGSIKGLVQSELCSLQEFLFRYYNKSKRNNKLWFFDYENAMLSKKELKI
jgi:hypothetical protein